MYFFSGGESNQNKISVHPLKRQLVLQI